MKISLIQSDILWENKPGNFEKLRSQISSSKIVTDIIVLPEMFNTGFSMNVEMLAEGQVSPTSLWMKSLAEEFDAGICGSFIIRQNSSYYNRWTFVSPDGAEYHYDKRHLFSPGGEDVLFSPGKARIVFEFRGLRIAPQVCYDLRFPVWSRNRGDYDIIINSASWPQKRKSVWLTLLKARAIENQCFVAGVNRIGVDGNGISHSGDSVLFGPKGETILRAIGKREIVLSADISAEYLREFRRKFPVWKDADDFDLKF